MTDTQPKDVEWLRDQLVALLADARAQEPADHQACAKYADLLFKMLPKGSKDPTRETLENVRKALIENSANQA